MEKRGLGNSDLELTTVGLGTWAIGGPWDWGWGPQSDTESINTIRRAVDLGINWIDTAPCYGLGHSESIVGQAVAGFREDVILATKCGLVWVDPAVGSVVPQLKSWSIRKEVEDSLRRLGTDYIDLYQVHWPNPEEDIEEAWTEIALLVEEGKIRYAGVSNFSPAQVDRARTIAPVTSHQPPYSMFQRGIEAELIAYCGAHEIGIIAYSPLQAGLLTGKFSPERRDSLPEGDWRLKDPHFQDPLFGEHLEAVRKLTVLAGDYGRSLTEMAIAWVLRKNEVTAAIVGARHPLQIEETCRASGWELPVEVIERITAILTP